MNFDGTGCHLRVGILTLLHRAPDMQNIFVAHILDGIRQCLVKDNLHDARTIAQIHEYQRTEIAPAGNPADNDYLLSGIAFAQIPIVRCSFHAHKASSFIFFTASARSSILKVC